MILQNYLMNFIRKYIANKVVYQSIFIEKSWNKKFGITKKDTSIISNCADKSFFQIPKIKSPNRITLTCVEGHLQDDETTKNILNELNQLTKYDNRVTEVEIYGKVKNEDFYEMYKNIDFKGHINRKEVSKIYREKKKDILLFRNKSSLPKFSY